MEPHDNLIKELMYELASAADENLSDSEAIHRAIERIRQEGYEVFLVVEANIKLIPVEQESVKNIPNDSLSAEDAEFLKALRIKINEMESE